MRYGSRTALIIFLTLAGIEFVKRCEDALHRATPVSEWGLGGFWYYLLLLGPLVVLTAAFPAATATPWAMTRIRLSIANVAIFSLVVAGLLYVYRLPLESLLAGRVSVRWLPPTLTVPAWVVAVVAVPTVEEWLFRGVLWRVLAHDSEARPRVILTLVLTSLLFGLSHLPTLVPGAPIHGVPLRGHICFGLIMGIVRWRTGSVTPGILIHASCNALFLLLAP